VFTGGNLCDEICNSTPDCVDPTTSCIGQAGFCGTNACTSSQYYGACASSTTNDGLCAPLGAFGSPGFTGLCLQSATNGVGGPGTACSINANRQICGFCDNADVCNSGICGAVCNSGTTQTPACPAGQTCVGAVGFWEIKDTQDYGGCVTPCDFTQLDGGGCGMSSANVPTKCLPGELLNYGPATGTPVVDMCSPLAASAVPIGGDCSSAPASDAIDPCVQGAVCLGTTIGGTSTCMQLCEDTEIGQTGAAGGCPSGSTCTGINFGAGSCDAHGNCPTGSVCLGAAPNNVCVSAHTGYCAPPATSSTTSSSSSSSSSSTSGASSSTSGATSSTSGATGTSSSTAGGSTSGGSTSSSTGGSTGTGSSGTTSGG
jgi:hypothetical protein